MIQGLFRETSAAFISECNSVVFFFLSRCDSALPEGQASH